MSRRPIFISADHGMAVVYFLQSDVIPHLLERGTEVVLLTDEAVQGHIQERFGRPGLIVEGLRLEQARLFYWREAPELQWWLTTLRRVGGSQQINTEAMDSYIRQIAVEEPNRRRLLMPAAWLAIAALRRSKRARKWLVDFQNRYIPNLYSDLFDRYRPELVVASTPGWRLDRYLLREAAARGIKTAAAVVGWDNPSSYSLPGAPMEWITAWSEIQRQELIVGSDWLQDRVNIGGIPSYDGYLRSSWTLPIEEYFRNHQLDPDRRLVSYACSFVSFAPNLQNVQALADLVEENRLPQPAQLLVRLHPNHFLDIHLYANEREQIHAIARERPHVHVVEPIPLGGSLGHYSGEDMPEKASMMAYSDAFVTVYSTMVVEAAFHDRPIISLCLDVEGGWNWPRKYSLPLSEIGGWPTHQRFRESGAGTVALTKAEMREAIIRAFEAPNQERDNRRAFIERECTYLDGSAGRRTGKFLNSLRNGALA